MKAKDESTHSSKAATKAAIYNEKAAEDKADIKACIEAYQNACREKKRNQLPLMTLPDASLL